AFALPSRFPGRDVIVLSAFAVVLGTLVVQGLTIKPLIKLLNLKPDTSLDAEVSTGRTALLDAALAALAPLSSQAALAVRDEYKAARTNALDCADPQSKTEYDRIRLIAIKAQRQTLYRLREDGRIDDDAFHRLEEELDWAELNALPAAKLKLLSV
ncbi:MAG: sodium/hydrogen exchanger, partial [Rhizobacter sp.]|nr:sodium/hydrogen exchanger [Rhizobacter sp.]